MNGLVIDCQGVYLHSMTETPHRPMVWSKRVAATARAWLGYRDISASEAARRLGWTQNYMSRRINAQYPFSVEDLGLLSDLLEIPIDRFFALIDPAPIKTDQGLINRINSAPLPFATWRKSRSHTRPPQSVTSLVRDAA